MDEHLIIAACLLAAFLALWIHVNLRAMKRIARSALAPARRRLFTTAVWLLPFAGALLARQALPYPEEMAPGPAQGGALPPAFTREDAPRELRIKGMPLFPFTEHTEWPLGLPLVDWGAVHAWADLATGPAMRTSAVDAARRAWMLHFREALGDTFHLYEDAHSYLLSSLEPNVVAAAGQYVATTRKRIAQVLGGVAQFTPGDKSVLLVMDDEEDYYEYVTLYYPEEGEFAQSGGMFINAGCPHFVCKRADLSQIEPVIAHELTHSAVHHLRLPRWLDEGLAVNTEERLTGARASIYTAAEMRAKHLAFWNDQTIQEFWSGQSFFRSDNGNMLSYDLARTVVQQMGRDWAAFTRFVAGAKWEDAGVGAAREAMSLDLPAYVSAVLGREPGPAWHPDSALWDDEAENAETEEEKAPLPG